MEYVCVGEMRSRSHASDSFSQIMEYSRAVPTLVCLSSLFDIQITAIGSSSSPYASCFFVSALRDVTVYDLRSRSPVQVLRLNSSLGAISSLVYGRNGMQMERRCEYRCVGSWFYSRLHSCVQYALSSPCEFVATIGLCVYYSHDIGTGVSGLSCL